MTSHHEESVAVDGQGPMSFGGTVKTVLETPKATPAPATLEEARNQPGRREQIEEITRRIESQGIKYVFFQQVSITGRVMGKGVVSSFFAQVAERGYQLVYGATANLFTDRGAYIGSAPRSPSSPRWPTSTPSPSCRGTRASRACTARLLRHRETGEQAVSISPNMYRLPQDVRGRRLLGAVQIRLGRPADAVKLCRRRWPGG